MNYTVSASVSVITSFLTYVSNTKFNTSQYVVRISFFGWFCDDFAHSVILDFNEVATCFFLQKRSYMTAT